MFCRIAEAFFADHFKKELGIIPQSKSRLAKMPAVAMRRRLLENALVPLILGKNFVSFCPQRRIQN